MSEIPNDVLEAARAAIVAEVSPDVKWQYAAGRHDNHAVVRAISRAILAERNRSKWQDISTAPKDGSNILSWADDWYGFHIVAWNEDEGLWADGTWCFRTGPTHWMPMEPPDLPADDPEAKP